MRTKLTAFVLVLAGLATGCATVSSEAGAGAPGVPATAGSDIDPMKTGRGSGVRIDPFGMMGALTARQVGEIANRIKTEPLGSAANPVRANQPEGQRAYIARLRCEDGQAPAILGRFNIGVGPYGSIVDVYGLDCRSGGRRDLALDMYHDWIEGAPAAGFTIVP